MSPTAEIEELMNCLIDIGRDRDMWKARALHAEYEATHDAMTGVLNRKGLFQAYEAGSYDFVYMIDIDGLKTVNDTLGHAGGDEYIKTVANQLEMRAEVADGVIARVGGDEFILLVKEIIEFGNPENFSYGWVRISDYMNLDAAIAQADTHMYTRKQTRKYNQERGTRGRQPVQRSSSGATSDLLRDPLVQGF